MSKYIEFTIKDGSYKPITELELSKYEKVGLYSITLPIPQEIFKQKTIRFFLKANGTGERKHFTHVIESNEFGESWIKDVFKALQDYPVFSYNKQGVLRYLPHYKNNNYWFLNFYNEDDAKLFGFDPIEFSRYNQFGTTSFDLEAIAPPSSFFLDDTILVKTNLIRSFIDDSTISNTLAVVNTNSNSWYSDITIKTPIYHPIIYQNNARVWLTDSGGNEFETKNFFIRIVLHVK